MSNQAPQSEERLLQLLADHATEGLDAQSAGELNDLLANNPEYDASYLEPVAAALDLAMSARLTEPLPDSLHQRIVADAERFFADTPDLRFAQADESTTRPAAPLIERSGGEPSRRLSRAGWYLAAASLGIAIAGWWQVWTIRGSDVLSPPQQYAEFVRNTDDMVKASWDGKEPGYEDVSGDVTWSDANQSGYMRLINLPPNDPKTAQYQLWVVDPNRDSHPVDGGVFDVLTSGEVIIPIDAKLRVDQPKVFAITLEKPGGVVVSGGPLLVVGAVAG